MKQISSYQELDAIMSNLHDCPFDLDRARHDEGTGVWSGTFIRPLWDDPRAQHRGVPLLYLRSRLPVAEAALTIAGVRSLEVIADQGIGQYSFNELECTAGGLRFHFNEALRIDLGLPGTLEATYDEQPLPGYCAIYRQLFLVQTGPIIEQPRRPRAA
jgi:hypothetical protein